MNSRERVLTTISHKEPDRVPIGEFGIDHDHVSNILGGTRIGAIAKMKPLPSGKAGATKLWIV